MKTTKKITKPATVTDRARMQARKTIKTALAEQENIAKIASQNKLDNEYQKWVKDGNAGTARMALGNVLAARFARGEVVKVAGRKL